MSDALTTLTMRAVLSPLAFLKRYTPAAVPSRYADYHHDLVELPDPGHSQCRVVFRGAAKTTVTRGMVLHAAVHRKVRGVLLIRATFSDAKADREALARAAVMAGHLATEDSMANLLVINGVPIWFRTPGGAVRGINWTHPVTGEVVRPDLTIADDLETRDTARSADQTAKILTWLFSDALATADQQHPMRTILLGTPITPTCLIAQAMRQSAPFDNWDTPLIVPILKADGTPAWPDNYDDTLRARIPEITLATEYDLDPLPPGTLLFPPARTVWLPLPASHAHPVLIGVDPAGDGADATAAVAMCLTPRGLHVVDVLHHTGTAENAPGAIGMFVRNLQQAGWRMRGISFEGVGAWSFMKREVTAQVAPVPVVSETPRESKVERLLPLTTWHKAGALSADPRLQGSVWDQEFHSMQQNGVTITGHDDTPDATAWAAAPLTEGWTLTPPAQAA